MPGSPASARPPRYRARYQETLRPLTDPELGLTEVVRGYAIAVLDSTDDPRAHKFFAFELESLAAGMRDPRLMSEVDAEVPSTPDLLTTLLTDRRIGSGARQTTAQQADRLALAVNALVTGFAQRAILEPGRVDRNFVIESAVQLTALLK